MVVLCAVQFFICFAHMNPCKTGQIWDKFYFFRYHLKKKKWFFSLLFSWAYITSCYIGIYIHISFSENTNKLRNYFFIIFIFTLPLKFIFPLDFAYKCISIYIYRCTYMDSAKPKRKTKRKNIQIYTIYNICEHNQAQAKNNKKAR